jgi:hypothetical protein
MLRERRMADIVGQPLVVLRLPTAALDRILLLQLLQYVRGAERAPSDQPSLAPMRLSLEDR